MFKAFKRTKANKTHRVFDIQEIEQEVRAIVREELERVGKDVQKKT